MSAYYNEYDKHAAAWLRELIKQGLIADGVVDERSIKDVQAEDLRGFTQHHFFAGIGGWSYALRLAGWGDDKPIWTGSCPCQPFSAAGKQKGKADDRHLWPDFFRLIRSCRPVTVVGEQVARAISHGWIDDLQADLEAKNYTTGAIVLGSHSVGGFHQRQRLYWVADSKLQRREPQQNGRPASIQRETACKTKQMQPVSQYSASINGLADTIKPGLEGFSGNGDNWNKSGRLNQNKDGSIAESSEFVGFVNANCTGSQQRFSTAKAAGYRNTAITASGDCSVGNTAINSQWTCNEESRQSDRQQIESGRSDIYDIEWLYCRDNKYRPIKPGIKPMVAKLPAGMVYSSDSIITPDATQEARAMRLKGYGNAIDPFVASEFIGAFMELGI